MRCPFCDAYHTRVVDTSVDSVRQEVRRRRRCDACQRRFSTVERVRASLPIVVKEGTNGSEPRRESFDRDKLRRGIEVACAKRPIPSAAIDRLVASVEARILERNLDTIHSYEVGQMVISGLRELDEIAYIRYAIVFLGLDDLAAVRSEIDRLLRERPQD